MKPEQRKETMEIICGCIAQGKSLVQILTAEGMPTYTTILRWLQDDEEIRGMYAHAREAQADYMADEIIYIADNEPDPQVARVRVDARKWVASKLKPRKYGDKIEQTVQNPDGSPLNLTVSFVAPPKGE